MAGSGKLANFRLAGYGCLSLKWVKSLLYSQPGFIAQLVEHLTGTMEVMGSNSVVASELFSGLSLQLL